MWIDMRITKHVAYRLVGLAFAVISRLRLPRK